jgi:ubiquinone/menaquinone biosynthesis C-methylase UbiE
MDTFRIRISERTMNERKKYLDIYSGEHAKRYENQNMPGKLGGGYGRICWGEGMLELMRQWKVHSLLDVGCGYGNFCDAATLFASRVYGLDIASVATGHVVNNPEIVFFDGQANSLPLPDGSVEWITSFDCLEHCLEQDIDHILNEFNRVAVKGFVLSISYEPCEVEGVPLHMTVKPESWWVDKLRRYGSVTKEGRVPITGVPYLVCRKPIDRKIICYCAGSLSARLNALASCEALAGWTGRQLAMVWQTDDPLCRIDFSDLFANPIDTVSDSELLELPSCKLYAYIKDVADQSLISGNPTLRKAVRKWGSTGIDDLCRDDDPDSIILFFGCDSTKLQVKPDPAFLKRLEPVATLRRRIDDLIDELGITRNIMGVHARGTDFGIEVKEYTRQMIKALEQNQGQCFLVCSEEERYEQILKQTFKDKVCIRPKSNWIAKIAPRKAWALGNIRTSPASIMEAVVDIYLLSRTDFRIYHESSGFAKICKILAS